MAVLQHFTDAQVQPGAAQAKHLVVQRFPDQSVTEAKLLRVRHRFDQVHRERLLERHQDVVFGLIGFELRQEIQLEGPSDARGDGQKTPGSRRKAIQALADDFADSGRNLRQ
jgi:hypothetical protein